MKTKKYWLRGGVSLLLVYVVLIFLISEGTFYISGDSTIILAIITPAISYFTSLHDTFPILQLILVYLQGLIGYFVVGAFIGWIYGKIKDRNHVGATMN